MHIFLVPRMNFLSTESETAQRNFRKDKEWYAHVIRGGPNL